jgi:hypothetical protein
MLYFGKAQGRAASAAIKQKPGRKPGLFPHHYAVEQVENVDLTQPC